MNEERFLEYKVTNAHMKFNGSETSENLGCTGKVEAETEIKTITTKCEGDIIDEIPIPIKLTGIISLHMQVSTARKVYGLDTKELKDGVYGYGSKSRQGKGTMTADIWDVYEEKRKLIAFPNIQFTGGYKWALENGQEEIVEIEVPFSAFKDSNGKFIYEALEADIKDEDVKEKWHTAFSPELVKAIKGSGVDPEEEPGAVTKDTPEELAKTKTAAADKKEKTSKE